MIKNLKPREVIILIAIGGGMLAAATVVLQQPRPKNDIALTSYSSPAEGYEVSYPASWLTGDLDHGKVSKNKDGIFIGSLTVTTKIKTTKQFNDYIDQDLKARINRASSKYQRFDTVAEKYTSIQGKQAYYLEIVTEQENDVHADHTVILYLNRGEGQLVALVMGVNENEWEKNPSVYRRSVNSLRLKS